MSFKKALLININEGSIDQDYWDKLRTLVNELVFVPKGDSSIMTQLTDTDCLLVGFGVTVNKDMINAAPDLKYIGVQATAFDKIDTEYAAGKGIPACNLGGYSTDSVAEFVIAVLLETIRGLETGKQRGREGNYSEDGISARELKDSQFGVIGLGNIGNRVAELASGFGAQVSYWSRSPKEVDFMYKELDTLIADSDFLSLNPALAPETKHLLNAERITSIKTGAVIINTCPMELIDLDALAERLAKNDITFILDHSDEMSEEDLAKLQPFANCIVYPPMAYITDGARKNKCEAFVGGVEGALNDSLINKVN
jgi:lactate dehydrogenase-like 2-hydroxyacid dehydrogenase